MKLHWASVLLAATSYTRCVAEAFPSAQKRDLPKEQKYFHEPGRDDYLGHYDVRFFKGIVSYEERTETLLAAIRGYLTFFREHGLETWIAHGSLLGWWWNGKILPWDWDVDTQVSTEVLFYMGDCLNQTTYKYVSEDGKVKRDFFLDVNPWSRQRTRGEGHNIIDARWIDIRTGLFIDITGVSEIHPDTQPGVLACKNFHKYNVSDLYPMREGTYEGVPAKIPYRYHDILIKEYGSRALTMQTYEDHDWNAELKEWMPDPFKIAETNRRKEEALRMREEEDKGRQIEEEARSGKRLRTP